MSEETNEKAEEKTEAKTEATGTEETGTEKAISTLDRADQIAQMQKRENDRKEALITRDENLQARKDVGGVTEGGKPTEKTLTEEERKKEQAEEYFKDTALGDDIKKTNE